MLAWIEGSGWILYIVVKVVKFLIPSISMPFECICPIHVAWVINHIINFYHFPCLSFDPFRSLLSFLMSAILCYWCLCFRLRRLLLILNHKVFEGKYNILICNLSNLIFFREAWNLVSKYHISMILCLSLSLRVSYRLVFIWGIYYVWFVSIIH